MSNAIDELRQFAGDESNSVARRLREIADRIESEYVELPRNNNGEVIHLRDTVRNFDGAKQ